ncbi:MAG: endonuclease/exonuclease/phosphatase family protein [Bacteroidota bacterium]|nr:endonuclease/exonuclease/phosphatase family protein [Bacteroidota bacterium]
MTENPAISISHVSLGNAENDYDSVINYLLSIKTDFVSFQELTPDWNVELTNRLSPTFPYIQTMMRMDQYGMGFFSKIPMESLDTLYYEEVPNLMTKITLGGIPCNIISCQLIPPVNQRAFFTIEKHFESLEGYMEHLTGAKIVVGDLHLPTWTSEVQRFKENSHLLDSRRDTNPRNIDGSVTLLRIPVEHIFFSNDFACISFLELGNSTVGRIGITGTYQLQETHAEVAE